jgi:hypothetical protein
MDYKSVKKEKKPMSPVGEIPILNLDLHTKLSNIMEVKMSLSTYSFKQYKTLGNCIEDLTLNDIPELNINEMRTEIEYTVALKKRLDKVELRNQELVHLYGVVLGLLSVTSREKVINSSDFQRIRESNDGFRLWCLVYQLHVRGREATSAVERFNQAERNYVNCIQREGESLTEFYKRFKACVRVMHQLTADPTRNISGSPSPAVAAAKFITNLSRVHYGELQRLLHNSGDYPTTLPDALERAGNYEPLMRTSKSERVQYGASVFNTQYKKKSNRPSQQEAKDEKVKTSFSGKCFNCGKVGHKAVDCRSKKKPARKPAEELKTNFHVEFDSEDEDKVNFTVLSGLKGKNEFDDFELLLDSGAQISVVKNCQLLTGLRNTSPITLYGMNDNVEGITCDTIGDVLGFGTAYLCTQSKANLLSIACDAVASK